MQLPYLGHNLPLTLLSSYPRGPNQHDGGRAKGKENENSGLQVYRSLAMEKKSMNDVNWMGTLAIYGGLGETKGLCVLRSSNFSKSC